MSNERFVNSYSVLFVKKRKIMEVENFLSLVVELLDVSKYEENIWDDVKLVLEVFNSVVVDSLEVKCNFFRESDLKFQDRKDLINGIDNVVDIVDIGEKSYVIVEELCDCEEMYLKEVEYGGILWFCIKEDLKLKEVGEKDKGFFCELVKLFLEIENLFSLEVCNEEGIDDMWKNLYVLVGYFCFRVF